MTTTTTITTSKTKVIATCLVLALSLQMCCGSAIPIWEFLTRSEKMSYLYSTFAQLVSVHCKATAVTSNMPVNQCKRNLLAYGYEKLQTFDDAQLDALDPYQREANELIWSSIMREHSSSTLITTRKPLPTPPASSIIILTHQNPISAASNADAAATIASQTVSTQQQQQQQHYPKNPIFDTDADTKHRYAMDMDIAYGYPATQQLHESSNSHEHTQPKTFLSGPLVIRVRPDGTPVQEDQYKPLPADDDLEIFKLTSSAAASTSSSAARPNKHRKIATISALKEQRLATAGALQPQLLPPLEQTPPLRLRRNDVGVRHLQSTFAGYHYGRGQS